MVEESGDGLEGFDIDIWDAVSRDLGYDSTYRLVRFDSLLPDIAQGLADVGIAGITITAEREETVDFSHQYFESGLRILVPAERAPSVLAAARSLFAPERIRWLLGLLALTVVCGHVLWWADRKAPVTTVGYGDVVPRNWPGRVAALLVMVVGVGFFGIAITQLSAEFAVQRLTSDIRHPRDLRGKAVVTVAGTTSIGVLRGLGADVVTVGAVEGMYPALDEGLAAAAVFDSPTLLRYARNEGAGRYEVVGGVFDAQDYGIAVPSDSPLREPINRALLRLKESGSYDLIYEKWFGSQG
jgi:ABC-type amino acid transport substrate-binding protein